ncbi:MAG: hypothetical protein AB1831_09755 [Pseudomonadota bacterium]
MKHTAWLLLTLPLLGCDQLKERAGIHDPAKIEAEGKAIGSACRHAGWGIEDCFRLNPEASKPAMFAGWKEMNEYMLKNNMEAVAPTIPPDGQPPAVAAKKPKKRLIELEPIDKSKVEEPNQEGDKGDAKDEGKDGAKADEAAGHAKPAH